MQKVEELKAFPGKRSSTTAVEVDAQSPSVFQESTEQRIYPRREMRCETCFPTKSIGAIRQTSFIG
jgi:hypothetical protein